MSPPVRLRAGGRTLAVELPPDTADGGTARVDGTAHELRRLVRAAAGPDAWELVLLLDGRVVRALAAPQRDGALVAVDGRVHRFVVGAADDAAAAAGPAGSGAVTAPMPGKIVALLVRAGEAVAAGQALVVLEAMKMESTLVAEVAGTVARVHVEAGATVEGGALLVEIDA